MFHNNQLSFRNQPIPSGGFGAAAIFAGFGAAIFALALLSQQNPRKI